jgi:hypothetical protein
MPANNEMVIDLRQEGKEFYEETLDFSEKSRCKITLPLSSVSIFTPFDENGKDMPVSSIMIGDIKTEIKVSRDVTHLKLKVTNKSSVDSTGETSPPTTNEDGDKISNCREIIPQKI